MSMGRGLALVFLTNEGERVFEGRDAIDVRAGRAVVDDERELEQSANPIVP